MFTEGRSLRLTPVVWDSLCDGVRVSASRKGSTVSLPNLALIAEMGADSMLGALLLLARYPEITASVGVVELYIDLLSDATKELPTEELKIVEVADDVPGASASATDEVAPMDEDQSLVDPIATSTPLDADVPCELPTPGSAGSAAGTPASVSSRSPTAKSDKRQRPPLVLSPPLICGVVEMLRQKSCGGNKLYLEIMAVLTRLAVSRENLVIVADSLIEIGRAAEKTLLKDLADLREEVTVETNRGADHKLVTLERFVAVDSAQAVLRRVLQGVAHLVSVETKKRTKAIGIQVAVAKLTNASAAAKAAAEAKSAAEATPGGGGSAAAPAAAGGTAEEPPAVTAEAAAVADGASENATEEDEPVDPVVARCDERIAIIQERVEALKPDLLWNELGACLETLTTLDSSQHMLMALSPGIECLLLYQLSLERGMKSDPDSSDRDTDTPLSPLPSAETTDDDASRMEVERISTAEKYACFGHGLLECASLAFVCADCVRPHLGSRRLSDDSSSLWTSIAGC
jgi:hypothetical protein